MIGPPRSSHPCHFAAIVNSEVVGESATGTDGPTRPVRAATCKRNLSHGLAVNATGTFVHLCEPMPTGLRMQSRVDSDCHAQSTSQRAIQPPIRLPSSAASATSCARPGSTKNGAARSARGLDPARNAGRQAGLARAPWAKPSWLCPVSYRRVSAWIRSGCVRLPATSRRSGLPRKFPMSGRLRQHAEVAVAVDFQRALLPAF